VDRALVVTGQGCPFLHGSVAATVTAVGAGVFLIGSLVLVTLAVVGVPGNSLAVFGGLPMLGLVLFNHDDSPAVRLQAILRAYRGGG